MSLESTLKSAASNLSPVSFGEGLFAGALQKPWNAIAQLSGDRLPSLHLADENDSTIAAKVGNLAGFALDMSVLTRLTGKFYPAAMYKIAEGPAGSALKLGLDGALYGGVFTSSDRGEGLMRGRLENAAVNGLTFAAMGGVSHVVEDKALLGAYSLKFGALAGSIYGGLSGSVHAFAQAGIHDHALPSIAQFLGDTASYAAFGGFFGAAHQMSESRASASCKASEQERPIIISRTSAIRIKRSIPFDTTKWESEETRAMAQQASSRIDIWYGQLEPRLGIHFTDPNVVLTLANARGQTEFLVENPKLGDAEAFEKLNAVSKPEGISFRASDGKESRNKSILMVSIENTAGLVRTLESTQLPGVAEWDPALGERSVSQWFLKTRKGLDAASKQGLYPVIIKPMSVTAGIEKGYPDQAILAFARKPPGELAQTEVAYADYYPCAQPNYLFDLSDQRAIESHAGTWGAILKDYFTSEEHSKLAARDDFVKARLESEIANRARITKLLQRAQDPTRS